LIFYLKSAKMLSIDILVSRVSQPFPPPPERRKTMKIIVFGDIHMATGLVEQIPGITTADLVLLNGDLTNYGGTAEVRQVLDDVMQINPNVLAQYGNLDRPEVNEYLEELGINLHGQARLVQGEVCLVGLGGSNYTPFNTPSEFAEEDLLDLAATAFRQAKEYTELAEPLQKKKIPVVFISHVPPLKTAVDTLRSGKHVGSAAVRRLIEHYHPDLCICGHIHEGKGIDKINTTPVYNTGMLRQGGWAEITIEHSTLAVTLQ
jgi:Icc-related predicted phosphoesterase